MERKGYKRPVIEKAEKKSRSNECSKSMENSKECNEIRKISAWIIY